MGAPVSLRVGRSADLTRHRRVIQHREPIKGEGFGGAAGRRTRDPSSVSFADTCLPAGRSAGLTRHRRVIQYRGPLKGKANGGTPFNGAKPSRGRLGRCAARGEGLTLRRDEKKREPPCGRLPFFFSSFWWRRSGRSETGVTGRRRGLRRGRRSWGCPWCRRSWCRL